jgi:hypothetical protein
MKKLSFFLFILLIATSCFPIKISSDFDKTAGFSSYKTYSFIVNAESMPYDRSNNELVLACIAAELEGKGFKKSDNPDVYIDLNVQIDKKKSSASSSKSLDQPTLYGTGYLYYWGPDFSTTNIKYGTYARGTMFIDMIDVRKKQLVWQGRGNAKVGGDKNPQDREKRIAEAVEKIFTTYPPEIK